MIAATVQPNMSRSGIEFVFAAFAIVLAISVFTGSLDPSPRLGIALTTISVALLAAAGIYARFTRNNKSPKNELVTELLFCGSLILGGIIGAVWPRNTRVETPYLSGMFALASIVLAGYWIRQYMKKTRP